LVSVPPNAWVTHGVISTPGIGSARATMGPMGGVSHMRAHDTFVAEARAYGHTIRASKGVVQGSDRNRGTSKKYE